jgi:hypothetical protein
MEMHHGLKLVILLTAVLQTSSVKTDRQQVSGPSSSTARSGQPGLNTETLFQ